MRQVLTPLTDEQTIDPEQSSLLTQIAPQESTGVGVGVAHVQLVELKQDELLHLPLEHTSEFAQSALLVHVSLQDSGVGAGVPVGVAVGVGAGVLAQVTVVKLATGVCLHK